MGGFIIVLVYFCLEEREGGNKEWEGKGGEWERYEMGMWAMRGVIDMGG